MYARCVAMAEQREVADRAARGFEREFGHAPDVVGVAPGRVNLIGEHTDYNDGLVMPMAIDAWCACAAGRTPADSQDGPWAQRDRHGARLLALDMDERARMPWQIDAWGRWSQSHPAGHWARYVGGVLTSADRLVAEARIRQPLGNLLDLAFTSSVPLGAGLSSSAALEVAVATAACKAWGVRPASPLALARACQRAEQQYAGVPCGIMDQCVSVMGRRGQAMVLDCRSMEVRHVPMPAEWAVVIVNTGVRHALATGEYARRRSECEAAAAALGVVSLRDATREQVESLSDAVLVRRARHVVTENARVVEFAAALAAGDETRAGGLMLESHASLRDDYEVSCPELDSAVEGLRRMPGVFGARMTGGGFGGSAIALAERERAESIARAARVKGLGVWTGVAGAVDGAWRDNGMDAVDPE